MVVSLEMLCVIFGAAKQVGVVAAAAAGNDNDNVIVMVEADYVVAAAAHVVNIDDGVILPTVYK